MKQRHVLAAYTAPPRPTTVEGADALGDADALRTVHHVLHASSNVKLWQRPGESLRMTLDASAAAEAQLVRATRLRHLFSAAVEYQRVAHACRAQIAAGWTSMPWELYMPPSGAAGAAPEAVGGAAGGGSTHADGAAPPKASADADRVRVLTSVPGFVSRDGLCAAVERGGATYDPLYLWTAEARDAAWRGLPAEERRKLSNRYGEQMRVRAPRAAAATPRSGMTHAEIGGCAGVLRHRNLGLRGAEAKRAAEGHQGRRGLARRVRGRGGACEAKIGCAACLARRTPGRARKTYAL